MTVTASLKGVNQEGKLTPLVESFLIGALQIDRSKCRVHWVETKTESDPRPEAEDTLYGEFSVREVSSIGGIADGKLRVKFLIKDISGRSNDLIMKSIEMHMDDHDYEGVRRNCGSI